MQLLTPQDFIALETWAKNWRAPEHSPLLPWQGAGYWASTSLGQGSEWADTRDYHLGDDLRAIHWKQTAKAGRIRVRQAYADTQPQAVILLDIRPSMYFGSQELKLQTAAKMALLLLIFLQKQGYGLHFYTFDRQFVAQNWLTDGVSQWQSWFCQQLYSPIGQQNPPWLMQPAQRFVQNLPPKAPLWLLSDGVDWPEDCQFWRGLTYERRFKFWQITDPWESLPADALPECLWQGAEGSMDGSTFAQLCANFRRQWQNFSQDCGFRRLWLTSGLSFEQLTAQWVKDVTYG